MRKFLVLAATLALPLGAACTVHQTTAPSESGPAELQISLRMTANPDRLQQDGLNASAVSVQAFDAGGHPIAVQVHLSVQPSGFGTLGTDINGNVVTTTDINHPVVVPFVPPATTTGANTTVTISAQMVGPNSVTAPTQQVTLVTQPAVAIATVAPVAVISVTPNASQYATNQTLTFDGSGSCGGGLVGGVCGNTSAITSYLWNFGDGSTPLSGTTISHSYTTAGTYQVTLTVTNDKKTQSIATQTVTVASVSAPTASFTASPTPVTKNVTNVNFNATASTAASGHTLTSYAWNFGDGTTASGVTAQHVFTAAGTYTVTLTVTDDVGQTKSTTATVTVT